MRVGFAGSSYGLRIGVCLGVGLEGWLRWFAHPFAVGTWAVPCFVPNTPVSLLLALQKWQLGVFLSLYLLVQNSLQLCMHTANFSPI